jgi:hypothetical protein
VYHVAYKKGFYGHFRSHGIPVRSRVRVISYKIHTYTTVTMYNFTYQYAGVVALHSITLPAHNTGGLYIRGVFFVLLLYRILSVHRKGVLLSDYPRFSNTVFPR